ncbi:tRNA (adenosine(37)-N6)-threonylcarbamoyltransferase complex dimerization subunit type 1 TsaB [Undibacterium flavidum]|uniref:tRNA (Adenosine(37)-N6)-threonylcarbamoyltransferase complex dimerization subunit type 1 TsaB n=1 Tax=Undibacterium flavidum TaxID=2762297 RepID=A0ABR6YED0_9BURK|nr:tRNA (adenosine(37)-N6)-threonylcarbamoyltransferase complex dimerization subunit type 1 TsaB [Undibacterium flavidum]MBC3874921.1 tRNA (adenosine(37)-N6)-threonylcarbamoyltransferase complex dimerization subunit type 1 TsaB [Undibacterium flavidum]
MTILLAIETSTDLASVALLHNHHITCRDLSGGQTHSYGLLPALQELLQEAGISLPQIDAIAFGCGPGAFTGVRTACGVVQGLAFGLQIPVLPVVSLLAMAEAAKLKEQSLDYVCCLDARMNEVYWAHYRVDGDGFLEIHPPSLSDLNVALDYAREMKSTLVLGHGLALTDEDQSLPHTSVMPHAQFTLQIAERNYQLGLAIDAAQAQPLYLRNKVAQTTAERALAREA